MTVQQFILACRYGFFAEVFAVRGIVNAKRILILFSAFLTLSITGQTTAPVAPKLRTDVKKSLDKGGRDALKHCEAEPDKDFALVAGSCLDLAWALRRQAKDEGDAHIALQRSCSLGNAGGCNELGKDLDAAGDHAGAMALWQGPTCGHAVFCGLSLLESISRRSPVDLSLAEQVGMPLCEPGGDDEVCKRLEELGVSADYRAIAQRHRAAQTQNLQNLIRIADDAAVNSDNAANQVANDPNASTNPFGAAIAAVGASKLRIDAQNWRNKAESYRHRLAQLNVSLLEIPQTPAQVAPSYGRPVANSYSSTTPISQTYNQPSPSQTIKTQPSQSLGSRVSNTPQTLTPVDPRATSRATPETTQPAPRPTGASNEPAALQLDISGLATGGPVNSFQYCSLPCPDGLVCTGGTGEIWQQTTSYSVFASASASVQVSINMSDGSSKVIPMYVTPGNSTHQFTMNVGCSVYAPPPINATQGSVRTQ